MAASGAAAAAADVGLGVRRRLPPGMAEAAGAARGPLQVLFLVDVSGSMSGAIAMVRDNLGEFMLQMPEGTVAALAWYSDVSDAGGAFGLVSDFTADREALFAATARLALKGGGDTAEAQYLALALALRLPDWGREGGMVVHITDAPPHTREAEACGQSVDRTREAAEFAARPELAGLRYDWLALSRALGEARVMVCTFLIGDLQASLAAPYYQALADLSGAPGLFRVADRSAAGIRHQVGALVAALRESAGAGEVQSETVRGVRLQVSSDPEKRRVVALRGEDEPGFRLYASDTTLSQPADVASVLGAALGGIVRADGATKRFDAKEGGADSYAAKLREAVAPLCEALAAALRDCPPEACEADEACAISGATLRELAADFVAEGGGGETDIARLFVRVASLCLGAPMDVPWTGGAFNFEDAWVVRVGAVRPSYRLCYQALLDYTAATNGGWQPADRAGICGAPDLVLRGAGEVSGVLPLAGRGALGDAVYRALAATPWLAAVTWHSVCRHAMPPPNAVAGVLGCALERLLRAPRGAAEAALTDAVVRSLRCLPWRAGRAQAEAVAAAPPDPARLRAALSAQADCPPAKAMVALAQLGAAPPAAALEVLTGELLARRLGPDEVGAARFLRAVRPAAELPPLDDPRWLEEAHPLERGGLAVAVAADDEIETLMGRARAAHDEAAALLRACGGAPEPLAAVHLAALALEAALLGPAGRAVAEPGGVRSLVRDTSRGAPALAEMLAEVLRDSNSCELAALAARRRKHAVATRLVPLVADALEDPEVDVSALATMLDSVVDTPLVAGVRLDQGDTPAVLRAARGCSSAAKLRLLVCGPWTADESPRVFCRDADAVRSAADRWLDPPDANAVCEELGLLLSTLKPGLTIPVAGAPGFNASMTKTLRVVREALGMSPEPEAAEFVLTRALVAEAAARGARAAGMALVREHGDVDFVTFHQDGVRRLAAWKVGPYERAEVRVRGYTVRPWPEEFRTLTRLAHVRACPDTYTAALLKEGMRIGHEGPVPDDVSRRVAHKLALGIAM